MTNNTLDKLEWLIRTVGYSHYKCEHRQDNTPRTSVKCAGCLHSKGSYEQSIQNVLNYIADREKKMLEFVIGSDDDTIAVKPAGLPISKSAYNKHMEHRNTLRAEIRQRAKEWSGDEA